MCWTKRAQFRDRRLIFASLIFFLFSGGAKFGEFRLGGCAKLSPGEALFGAGTSRCHIRCPKFPPPTFGHLMRFGFVQSLRFAAVTGSLGCHSPLRVPYQSSWNAMRYCRAHISLSWNSICWNVGMMRSSARPWQPKHWHSRWHPARSAFSQMRQMSKTPHTYFWTPDVKMR